MHTCDRYKSDAQQFVDENKLTLQNPQKAWLTFFKDKFKIIGKSYKTNFDREKTEAFLIRTKRPKINNQFVHKLFQLFGA